MASREVVVSVCDRCTVEVTSPFSRRSKKHSEVVLPQGWLHVAGNTATALVFEMDLCAECKQIVLEVAGKARQVHSTASKAKADKADTQPKPKVSKADAKPKDSILVGVG